MELTKKQQAYLNICEENGWSYSIDEKYNEVELSQSSPAGEDFSFIVSLEDLPDEVHSFIFNFDVDEHVDMRIEARRAGVEGVPTTRELVDDAEAIEQMLEELSRALLDHKKDMVVDGLKVFNKTLEERGSKAIFVDLPTKDTVWGVIELEVILNVGSKKHKEYIQAFYDYYARGTEEGCFEPFQADFDKACEEFRTLHADDPRYNNATIDANDWMDPIEVDERIFDLDAEALRVVRDVNTGFQPFDKELLAEYQAVMVDICRSLGVEPRVDIGDPTYYQEVIDNAVAGLREPSLKNAVVLKQQGDDALLFTGNNVEPFVVALGYDPERKDWSAGTYYSDLRQAVCDFDKQFGTLGYSYNLSLDDLYPLLEKKGFEPTHENVRALMLNTNDFEGVSEYINENLMMLFDGEISSVEEVLEQSPARTMPEKSFHARSIEEIKAQQQSKSCSINPKDDLAMGREVASQNIHDHNHNIGRSR